MYGLFVTDKNEAEIIQFENENMMKVLKKHVDGYVEVVHPMMLQNPFIMIVNEMGRFREDFDLNMFGSFLYQGVIVGPIVIVKEGWVGDEKDIIGLSYEEAEELKQRLMTTEAFGANKDEVLRRMSELWGEK